MSDIGKFDRPVPGGNQRMGWVSAVAAGEPYFLDVHVKPGYSSPMVTRATSEASTGQAS